MLNKTNPFNWVFHNILFDIISTNLLVLFSFSMIVYSLYREINWVNIRVIITTYIIEILDLKKNYWFGVSMETGKMSSGFTWKSCYYRRDIG